MNTVRVRQTCTRTPRRIVGATCDVTHLPPLPTRHFLMSTTNSAVSASYPNLTHRGNSGGGINTQKKPSFNVKLTMRYAWLSLFCNQMAFFFFFEHANVQCTIQLRCCHCPFAVCECMDLVVFPFACVRGMVRAHALTGSSFDN